ncbi:MAG: cytosolic protein [Bacteroidota bacterium]|nr:cytosolic protein [Bacteroidota bacterium]
MNQLNLRDVAQYVENHIGNFHKRRLEKVTGLQLKEVLLYKNPYLFKAKNVKDAHDIVQGILSASISSSEESIFGNWLERLAIFINDLVFHGRKAGIPGIDLDFDRDGKRYIVAIKSGPNWGNAGQIKNLINEFNTARKRFTTSGGMVNLVCVNGCCYGKTREKYEYNSKGNYYKLCGQRFWELISGNANLYTELIIPLGHEAQTNNDEFNEMLANLTNRLTLEFMQDFCNSDGSINWDKLIVYNSAFIPNIIKSTGKKINKGPES